MSGAANGARISANGANAVQDASGSEGSKGKRRSKEEMMDYYIPKM